MKKVNPLLIIILALGVFGIITTEMGIIGVLPQVTQKFNISTSQSGWLVSIFALVVAISGPFLTLLASGINRKIILLTAVLIFAISNIVYAYTTMFEVMLIFRIIPAIFHPVFFSVALVTAAQLVPPEKSTKAVTKVFAGITVGFAFGVPLTSYLADKISLEVAFLFGAVVSIIAFLGILAWLPSMPVKEKMSYGKQLGILRKPLLWLNIVAVIFIFAAMFSVYSYFAEYLGQVTHMNGSWISIMLMTFGIIMIFGNFLFGSLLHKGITKTVIMFPLLYAVTYLFVYYLGSYFLPMVVIIIIWGAVHSGGLIVSQAWLTTEAKEAPEFGNSLFISFSNLGITIGTAIGGWFISHAGIHQLIWIGIMFSLLAFLSIIIKIKISKLNVVEVE
ncbi:MULTISPECIES: MFS transporter [Paenibacillus]|uniref:MFS transporter n=1 Tax=Paenibacillus TaxID=44249 RepID=UPI00096DF825|nr:MULTISPECIES: MFS transporter [Paenibacillus]MDH6427095.1 DHA1 family inner membrane transport protein [Paenibacillus sp. PastH-4]MDH6443124.1 DHA1 family inner membrane transport protein [Paenibacillus sp. PastF-4]MDH6526170.1 DHA1 family inner membrane transport protein [Paenibacillus sp. PastH-3]OMD61114.1 arabinose ABC transporter permease [Paenibacillus odorifer]